jgi:hypothetical protein
MTKKLYSLSDETVEMIQKQYKAMKRIHGTSFTYDKLFLMFGQWLSGQGTEYYNMEKLKEEFINKIKEL